MSYLSDENLISETAGLSSIGQVIDTAADETFVFNDIFSTGETAILYFLELPSKYKDSLKKDYLKPLKSLIKVKVKNRINLKEIFDEQLKEKYKDVF